MTDMVEKVARALEDLPEWAGPYEQARAAIEAMRAPTEEQLDAVRHLMMWLNFDRPTESALLDHCKRSAKEPPKECRDVDHVPPKALRTFWLYRAMIDAALNPPKP